MREHALSVDPGLRPGVVEWEREQRLDGSGIWGPWVIKRVSHRLDPWVYSIPGWDIVATELQWLFPGGKARPNDILQLAFRAGYTLASIPAVRRIAVKPQVWRGGTTVDKATVQRRILAKLTPAERALFRGIPEGRHGDVLDAIGIGLCALALGSDTSHDWIK